MGNSDFDEAFNAMLASLKRTEEYINYRDKFAAIQHDESAKESVDRIRELNMRVSRMSEEEYERESEELSSQMEELCSDVRVADFILAEVDFSKLFQGIIDKIVSALDEEG